MRDLEERVDRIEGRLSSFEIIDKLCPKCNTFMPMIKIIGNNYIIRCLGCLQRLVHIERYEIVEEDKA